MHMRAIYTDAGYCVALMQNGCYTGLHGTVISPRLFVGATSRVIFKARTGEILRRSFSSIVPARRKWTKFSSSVLFLDCPSISLSLSDNAAPPRAAATLRPRWGKMQSSFCLAKRKAQGTYFVSLRWHKALRFARNDVLRKEIRARLGNVSSEFLTCPKRQLIVCRYRSRLRYNISVE